MRRRLVLLLGATLVAVGLGEVVCRWVVPAPPMRLAQDRHELNRLGLGELADVLVADPDRFWRLRPGTTLPDSGDSPFFGVIANDQGFREDHVVPRSPPAGERRVLFIGDSCTFGFGVAAKETYVARCEERLAEAMPRTPIECLNAGVPGYTLFQGWRYLQTEGIDFEPEVVVACFGFNERADWDNRSDLEHHATGPPGLLKHSRLVQRAWSLAVRRPDGSTSTRFRVSPGEFRQLLSRLKAAANRGGARLLLLSWAERFQVDASPDDRTPWQVELYDFARRRHVPLVDLVPVMQQWSDEDGGSDSLFLDFVHVTPRGHERIAGLVSERVRTLLTDASRSPGP